MKKNDTPKILFTNSATSLILEAFKKHEEEGLIIDSVTNEPILTNEHVELEVSRLGGIKKGSEIFIKDDINSIMNLVKGNI
jgi:hypothetical protein